MGIGRWMYNLNNSEIWLGNEFNTKEEAIEFGKQEIKDDELSIISFEVGQVKEVPISGVDIDSILENVAENTTSEVGEVGDDYLCDVTREDRSELEEKLNEVFFKWIKEHKYEPNFYKIENIEQIK